MSDNAVRVSIADLTPEQALRALMEADYADLRRAFCTAEEAKEGAAALPDHVKGSREKPTPGEPRYGGKTAAEWRALSSYRASLARLPSALLDEDDLVKSSREFTLFVEDLLDCGPPAILDLLDAIERITAEREMWRVGNSRAMEEMALEIGRLTAENATLRGTIGSLENNAYSGEAEVGCKYCKKSVAELARERR